MTDPDAAVTRTLQDGILALTLANPTSRNAVTNSMWEQLAGHLDRAQSDQTVRAVVLAGAGEDFTSGIALGEPPTHRSQLERLRWINGIVGQLHSLPKPTIARVDGIAFGIGLGLALACDLLLASDRARFCAVFTRRALTVDGGVSWLLPRRVGHARAAAMTLLAEEVGAAQALEIGLATQVVAAGELDDLVAGTARRLAAGPPLALGLTKTLLAESARASFAESLEQEARAQSACVAHPDFAEAVAAFREHRTPTYA